MGREKRTCQGKKHFSHSHILKLIANPVETLTCNACDQQSNSKTPDFFGCNSCQYFLHENCLNAPRFLDHSSHPSHDLTLLPIPTYSNRSYKCKACGSAGNGFSFSCARCEFDIHMQCALFPQTVLLPPNVHRHELELTFESPFDDEADESTVFVCDLCHDDVDLNYWFYYCADCDFGTHLQCVNSKSVIQQERKLSVNKPKPNPVGIMKTEEEPIKIQEEGNEDEEEEEVDTAEEEEVEAEEEEEVETKEEEEVEAETEEEEEAEEEEKLKNARSILIEEHPHELELWFYSPYYGDKDTKFACDICDIIMDRDESLYYCADCDFGAHLQCACPDVDAAPAPKSQQRQSRNQNLNSNSKYPNANANANATVEMINSVNDAHDRLIAAQIESRIAARSRQAMLELWDEPSGRYYYD